MEYCVFFLVGNIHTDHLGTPRFGSNTGGTQVWAWASDAFGVGTPSGTRVINLRMPGQYFDSESDLFYNWNRYYNPAIGRYVSSDPIGLSGGLNTFSYAEASPVMYADPEGLFVQVIGAGVRACLANPVCRSIAVDIAKRTGQALADAAKTAMESWNGATPVPPVCPPVTQNQAEEGAEESTAQRKAEQERYHNVCDTKPPSSGDPCLDAQAEVQRHQQCIDLRIDFGNKWYGGNSEPGHAAQIAQKRIALEKAKKDVAKYCGAK